MMKRQTNLITPFFLIGYLIFFVSGCAKYVEYEAIFPPDNEKLTKYKKIVVVNDHRGDLYHDLFENALKTQLTSINPGNIDAIKTGDQIGTEIKALQYNPKVDTMGKKSIAVLSYKLQVDPKITREKSSRTVSLQRCNYLLEKNPCRYTGTAQLVRGNQSVRVMLTGKVVIKDGLGNQILPPHSFNRLVSDSNQFVKSDMELASSGLNTIAYDFARKIIPHREKIKSEILTGGDAVSVAMIENRAYSMAVNRLGKIVADEEEPEVDDLYNLGIAYEALNEVYAAADFLFQAKKLEPDHQLVKQALKRIRRLVPE